jgi:thioredoxin 1
MNPKYTSLPAGVWALACLLAVAFNTGCDKPKSPAIAPAAQPERPASPIVNKSLPRLVDLGADKCVPCKMMAPILRDLREEFKGKVQVDFIDVWKEPQPGRDYKIRVIPTQIFFNAQGKELFRHEGFYSREEILAKWRELGFISN